MSERRVRTLDAPARFVTKDMVMCVVVLAVIALVAGVLLGLVNWLTYVDPAAAVAELVAEHYGVDPSLVSSAEDRAMSAPGASSTVDAAYVVSREGETLAYAYLVSGAGAYKGTVQFIFYVTPEGRIEGTEVYASSETAGIGSKVLTKDNLARLVGLDLGAITDYGDVGSSAVRDEGVYITGATYTSKSLVNAVRALAYAFAAASGEVTP